MRLDVYLAGNGTFRSRSKAAEAINAGFVTVNGAVAGKPSLDVDGTETVVFTGEKEKYVSRAGEKLEHALVTFGIDVKGLCVLDIGASTGGFTDCLLQHGAGFVYALDVGSGQLDARLRADSRVAVIENFNARNAKRSDFSRQIDMITMDVSFISQSLIYNACADILPPGGVMLTLVKPQFEAGRKNIGKGGIVNDKDGSIIAEILARLDTQAEKNSFTRVSFAPSPIKGGDGNTEYLAAFVKN